MSRSIHLFPFISNCLSIWELSPLPDNGTSRLQNPKHASSSGINGVKYYANFFFIFAQGSLPYFAVIWFCVLQILKCLHGGCGQLNKQQLSPISGGQLLTKKKKDKENRKAAKTGGRKTQQRGGPRVCGIVANLSSRESRRRSPPSPSSFSGCAVCRPRKLTISRRITQRVQLSFRGRWGIWIKVQFVWQLPAMRC